jgi:small subunit ribosomal protein S5
VVELVGARNVIAKTLGRGNPFNTVRATLDGLMQLRNPDEVLRLRRRIGTELQEGVSV